MKKIKYVCAECGNEHIVTPAWVDYNTQVFTEWYEPGEDNVWCDNCDKLVNVIEQKDETN